MTQLTINDKVLLIVPIPEDAHSFEIDEHLYYKASYMGMPNIGGMKKLPAGHIELIGKGNEISEEQWGDIIKSYSIFDTAKSAGCDLLRLKGFSPEKTVILQLK